VSGRIAVHLDQGLGWTRCPFCGARTARRLPGTTSPATDLAVARGRRELAARRGWPPARQPVLRSRRLGRR
jgi:hypothetical protein